MPVTDRRIIIASPRALLLRGELVDTFPLVHVQFVRPPQNQKYVARLTLDVITEHRDLRWIFPAGADVESVDKLALMLEAISRSGQRSIGAVEIAHTVASLHSSLEG